MTSKEEVRAFWERHPCGEVYADGEDRQAQLDAQAAERYRLEPYLEPFARFQEGRGRKVLAIGVGMGADHFRWAQANPQLLVGIDLTRRAVEITTERLAIHGLKSSLFVADAEALPFRDAAFDIVYSWGVLHHSPDTQAAVDEVYRVLRPGGTARVLMYNRYSLVGAMLWIRYGLLSGRPNRSLSEIYSQQLESPGTQAFTVPEAIKIFARFSLARVWTRLSMGDLLEGAAGQRHNGRLLRAAKAVWPRWLLRRVAQRYGLALMIEATK